MPRYGSGPLRHRGVSTAWKVQGLGFNAPFKVPRFRPRPAPPSSADPVSSKPTPRPAPPSSVDPASSTPIHGLGAASGKRSVDGEAQVPQPKAKKSKLTGAAKRLKDNVEAADGGYIPHRRGVYRSTNGHSSLPSAPRKGNAMTCLPDSVLVLLHAKGIDKLSLLDLRKAMPAVGPAKFQDVSTILEAATEHTLERVSEEFKKPGGLELAVLQKSEDFLVLQVHANDNGAPSLSQTAHCMAYTGSYLIDNFSSNNVIQIEESDRKDKTSARAVFNTMFPEFDKVQIRNVYRLRALAR